jgi:hypothetical protein
MPDDHVNERIAHALRQLDQAQQRSQRELAEQRAQIDHLIELLIARQTLAEGHRRHLARVARHDAGPDRRVRLRTYVDKRAITPAPPIDCDARYPLCRARCCMLRIELTAADVEEGKLRWNLEEPYLLRKDADGQCSHIDRATGGCTVYEDRPATCREYDCRKDSRIWLDFERRIPAPTPLTSLAAEDGLG